MDHEKAYKESFEAAKGLHEAGNALTKKQMEIVFPQLAESEDEKIRKFLIDYFTSYKIGNVATKLNGYRIDDILAYLEKQKEQKPNYCHYGGDPSVERCKYCSAACSARLTEEQKPVVTHGETYRVDTLGTQQVIAGKMPQKPAEWSEEDEENMQAIVDTIKMHWLTLPGNTLIDWLKSLRNRVGKEFLQPHWKPSEEDMNCLKFACENRRERHNASVNGDAVFLGLTSLYNNLKKLM